MKLNCVTISGADDQVDPKELLRLYQEYPFVEFGIMFSSERHGQPRYPSWEWIDQVVQMGVPLSGHLCGDNAFKSSHLDPSVIDKIVARLGLLNRFQINLPRSQYLEMKIDLIAEKIGSLFYELILQSRVDFERGKEVLLANRKYGQRLSMLHDGSGGTGKRPTTWPKPVPGVKCGYAGGINPGNIASILVELDRVCDPDDSIWIDMETGIRDDDQFSIPKVRECLSISRIWHKR